MSYKIRQYPHTFVRIGEGGRTKTGKKISAAVYRCMGCKKQYKGSNSLTYLRSGEVNVNPEGFHISEYVCSAKCSQKMYFDLVTFHRFWPIAVLQFGRHNTGALRKLKSSPVIAINRVKKGVARRTASYTFKCHCCDSKYKITVNQLRDIRKQAASLNAEGIHWHEYFCGIPCLQKQEGNRFGFADIRKVIEEALAEEARKREEKRHAMNRKKYKPVLEEWFDYWYEGRVPNAETFKALHFAAGCADNMGFNGKHLQRDLALYREKVMNIL